MCGIVFKSPYQNELKTSYGQFCINSIVLAELDYELMTTKALTLLIAGIAHIEQAGYGVVTSELTCPCAVLTTARMPNGQISSKQPHALPNRLALSVARPPAPSQLLTLVTCLAE